MTLRLLIALLLALAALVPATAQAEWRRAESPNFILYSEGSESRLRERILLLEDFDRLLRTITTITDAPPAANKLHVYVLDGHDQLNLVRTLPAGIVGFYIATPDGIAALVDGRSEGRSNEVLFHEYVHHFMHQYAPNAYPAWYVEGFAEYLMTARFERRRIDIGDYSPGRQLSITQGRWLPIDRVLFGSTEGLDRETGAMFYAQSWLLVHWFNSTNERLAALRRYLVAARAGGDPAEALRSATGLSPAELNDELRRYVRGTIRFRRMERSPGETEPPVTVTVLPRSADDLMAYAAALRIGIGAEFQEEQLARIRAAAARHSGDPFAARILAHAEALYGDGDAADRLLEPLLAATPGDFELMYMKAMRHLRAAEAAEADEDRESHSRQARSWFTRAHNADPDHFPTLYRYAQSLRGERGFLSENTRNIMLLAASLAPQVAEIRMNAAAMLIALGETEDAVALLRPLAADPHNSGLAEAAGRLIAHAEARSAGAGREPADPESPEAAAGDAED